jgi:hypothetical protein
MDVILRSNNTDRAKPGDRMVFTGMLAVCPDVGALSGPGAVNMKPGMNILPTWTQQQGSRDFALLLQLLLSCSKLFTHQ